MATRIEKILDHKQERNLHIQPRTPSQIIPRLCYEHYGGNIRIYQTTIVEPHQSNNANSKNAQRTSQRTTRELTQRTHKHPNDDVYIHRRSGNSKPHRRISILTYHPIDSTFIPGQRRYHERICSRINRHSSRNQMAGTSSPQYDKCIIYVDNQASIKAINTLKQQSAQYIIRDIFESLDKTLQQRPNLKFTIEWVPGHMDISGNDKAHEEAKKAALNKPIEEQTYPQHRLKSGQCTKITANITIKAKTAWNEGTANARQLRKISRPQRFKTGVELYHKLTRKQITNLIRLRTGHCRLNNYLNKRKIIEDPT